MKALQRVFRNTVLFWTIIISTAFAQQGRQADTIIIYRNFGDHAGRSIEIPGQTFLYHFDDHFRVLEKQLDNQFDQIGEEFENHFKDIGDCFASTFEDFPRSFNSDDDKVRGEIEKTKTINKNYNVTEKDKLAIENKFGNVKVETWDKNEIAVDIEIKANHSSEEKAQKLLDIVKIEESRDGNTISLKTKFTDDINTYSSKGNGKSRVEINYKVRMPDKNSLSIINKFGSTTIADFSGSLDIQNEYGSFSAGNLKGDSKHITVKYGNGKIESINEGNLLSKYGSMKVMKAGSLTIDHKYGSFSLGEADKLNADIDYSGVTIGKLNEGGVINLKYSGGFTLEDTGPSLQALVIDAAYSNIKLGFDDHADFDFDVNVTYGSFGYPSEKVSGLNKNSDDKQSYATGTYYSGKFGKGGTSRVVVKSKYGSVKFE